MSYALTKSRVLQWLGIILIIGVFAGAYWYFKVYGSTLNAPQNDLNTNGLVGLWSFNGDDISGATAYDRSGSGSNGSLGGGTTPIQGKVGQALAFSSSQMAVSMTQTGKTYTFSVWTKISGGGGYFFDTQSGRLVLDFGQSAPSARSLSFYDGTWKSIGSANSIPLNEWVHLVWVFDNSNSTAYGYINGALQGTSAYVGTNIGGATCIGDHFSCLGSAPMGGALDELRIYNRALAAGEIQSLYAQGGGTKIDSAVSQPQGTGRLDSGLAGYWKLDDGSGTSATDSSANGNTGTLTASPTWSTGQIGGAVTFNDNYINIPDSSVLDAGTRSLSWSFWMKTSQDASSYSWPGIVAKEHNLTLTPRKGWQAFLDSTSPNKVKCAVFYNDLSDIATSNSALNDNAWHHVTCVRNVDGNGISIYVDGVLNQTSTLTNTGTNDISNSVPLEIGARNEAFNTDNGLVGQVDEVRVYNRVLSADEVSQLYRLSTPTSVDTGLKGYWSFNGKDVSGATAYDRSGVGNNGTLTNSPAVTRGKLGQALDFNGTSQYGTLGPSNTYIPSASSPFALSVWFKASSIGGSSNINRILSMRNGGSSAIILGVGSTNQVQFYNSGTATHYNVATVSTGQWYHYVLTYNGTAFQPYIDGIAQGSPITATGPTTNSIAATLGTFGGSDFFFAGSIDEVRIYNRALTAGEVKGLYDVGADDKTNSSVSQPQGTGRLDSGLAGYWKLDDGSGTSATDSSTNSNTGTLTNGPTWTTGQIGGAVTFDGTDDRVVTTHTTNLNTYPITVSTWVKTSVNDATRRPIVSKYSFLNGYALYMSGGKVLAWYMGNGSNYIYTGAEGIISTTTVSDDAWHNVVFTVDIVGGKLYVDGKLEASRAWTGTPQASTTTNGLGLSYPDGGSFTAYLAASIDDTRIYNRALSSDEVAQLYRLNAPTGTETGLKGYWSFNGKDLSSTTAYDRSGAGNNGTLAGGPTVVTGKLGQGLSFNGTNQYISFSDTTSLEPGQDITITAWVYLTAAGSYPGIVVKTSSFGEVFAKYALYLDARILKFAMGGGVQSGSAALTVPLNTWTFVAAVNNASGSTLYMNGTAEAFSAFPTPSYTTHQTYIGSWNGTNGMFPGKLDEVRLYNRALTEAEIKSLYNASR